MPTAVTIAEPSPGAMAALRAIAIFHRTTGAPPTYRDVGHTLGIRVQAVVSHFAALERCGCVTRKRSTARGVRLTTLGWHFADGFQLGSPEGQQRAVAIDTRMASHMRCGSCYRRGLAFIALHRGNEYGAVLRCPRCSFQEGG
jgi:hypothetical protein